MTQIKQKNCFILAGELSGEEHAESFLPQLIKSNPDYHFWGVGGDAMKKQGMELIYSISDFSSMGFTEVIAKLSFYKNARKKILSIIKQRQTKVAILIDFQGFNMSLLKPLFALNVKILYFVAPQAWAWKSWRTVLLQKYTAELYCILPFEEKWFKERGVYQSQTVAHPSFKKILSNSNAIQRSDHSILWLPGSRKSEILNHWKIFLNVQKEIKKHYPEFQHCIVASPAFKELGYEKYLDSSWSVYSSEELFTVLAKSTLAVAVSGTVTLNCAFMETPTIVCYRVNPLNAWIFRSFIKYKGFVSLANLMLNKAVFPELLQEDCNQGLIFLTIKKWITDKRQRDQVSLELKALVDTQKRLNENTFNSMDNYLKKELK